MQTVHRLGVGIASAATNDVEMTAKLTSNFTDNGAYKNCVERYPNEEAVCRYATAALALASDGDISCNSDEDDAGAFKVNDLLAYRRSLDVASEWKRFMIRALNSVKMQKTRQTL